MNDFGSADRFTDSIGAPQCTGLFEKPVDPYAQYHNDPTKRDVYNKEVKDVLIEELQLENTKLKKLNELLESRCANMEILYKNAKGDYLI